MARSAYAQTIQVLAAIVVCVPALISAGPADHPACDTSSVARALCDAESALTEALRRNDADRLSEIYTDDFQLTNYRGRLVDKAGVVAAVRSGALRFDALDTSGLQIRVYTDVGVITGVQHQVAREPGGDGQAHPNDVRFIHVYVLRNNRWRLAASQITPILATPARPYVIRRDTHGNQAPRAVM